MFCALGFGVFLIILATLMPEVFAQLSRTLVVIPPELPASIRRCRDCRFARPRHRCCHSLKTSRRSFERRRASASSTTLLIARLAFLRLGLTHKPIGPGLLPLMYRWLRKPEVVPHLVPERFSYRKPHRFFEGGRAALVEERPRLVEERQPIKRNGVGEHTAIELASVICRHAPIESEQGLVGPKSLLAQHPGARFVLNQEGDIFDSAREARRNLPRFFRSRRSNVFASIPMRRVAVRDSQQAIR